MARANAAQRRRIQQRFTDAEGFSQTLREFGLRTQAETQQILDASAAAVYQSVVFGSPLTNAPGQPVDTSELRDSWKIRRISSTAVEVYTESPYARAIEHNWKRVARAKLKWAIETMGLGGTAKRKGGKLRSARSKRMGISKATYDMIRKGFRGLNFRSGGAHSVKLTAHGFSRLVQRVVLELYPDTRRNLAGGIRARGVGIDTGVRSGTGMR